MARLRYYAYAEYRRKLFKVKNGYYPGKIPPHRTSPLFGFVSVVLRWDTDVDAALVHATTTGA